MKLELNDHFFAWAFIYAIGVFLSIQLIRIFGLQGSLLGIFLVGLTITLFSLLMYSFMYKGKFRLNKWFFIWFFTHSFNFWLIDLILRKLGLIQNGVLYFFVFGIIYHIATWIIKHRVYYNIKMTTSRVLIIMLIFLIALLFISSQPFSEIQTTGGLSKNSTISAWLNSLIEILPFSPVSNNCPQINASMIKGNVFNLYYITNDPYSLDSQDGWEILVYGSNELFGMKLSTVYCHKGNVEGENPNYYYCDSGTSGIPYLSKTLVNPDGTIGKTIKKSFINIYSSDKKFIKTICGKPPEEIAEENFKQTMREIDDFFSLK